MQISSRANPVVKELRGVRDGEEPSRVFLEGLHLLQEVLKSGLAIETLVIATGRDGVKLTGSQEEELSQAAAKANQVLEVSSSVFQAVSDVDSPQGVIAICARPSATWEIFIARKPAPIIVLDGIQDPGNAGAIVRTAEAAGAAGLVATPGTAKLYSPKALRASMGSSLRLPIIDKGSIAEIAKTLKDAGYGVLGATSRPEAALYTTVDWKQPWAIVLGQEGRGLSDGWQPHISKHIKIPMKKEVESLNVAAAAAVLLYART